MAGPRLLWELFRFALGCRAVGAHGHVVAVAEEEGEVAFAGESAFLGNLADRQAGLREQGADALEFDAPDLVHDRAADRSFEMILGIAA